MIRPDDLAKFLASVRDTIASELRPDLKSDNNRAKADSVLLVLDRLITDMNHGGDIAAARLGTWEDLRGELRTLGLDAGASSGVRAAGYPGAVNYLQAEIGDLQNLFDSEAGFASLKGKLASGDGAMHDWFSRAVNALVDLTVATEIVLPEEKAQAGGAVAPDETDRLHKALSAYLKKRYPELPDDPVAEFRLSPGGYAKQTGLFKLKPNSILPTRLVMRLDMAVSITTTSVKDEYPVIHRAFDMGLPVPRPVLLEEDKAALGGRFMLMTEVEDSAPSGPYFPEERKPGQLKLGPEFGKEVARTLAKLHSGSRTSASSAVPDYQKVVADSHAAWQKIEKSPFSVGTEMGYAWLLSHPLGSDRPWCTVHGDFGAHNILVRDGHLSGLIDWELAHPGDPAEDIAQCRMMLLPGIMEWKDFVREYIAAGGDPKACDEQSVGYFCVWIYLFHLSLNAVLRQKFLAGERTDILAANVVSHYHSLLIEYLVRALKIAVDASKA